MTTAQCRYSPEQVHHQAERTASSSHESSLAGLAVGALAVALLAVLVTLTVLLRPREVVYSTQRAAPELPPPPPPVPASPRLSDAEITALQLSLWDTRAQLWDTVAALEATARSSLGTAMAASDMTPVEVEVVGSVDRRSNLSYEEFNRSYSARGRPVIITDYQERLLGISQEKLITDDSGPQRWSLERLAEPRPRGCGDVLAVFHRYTEGAKTWARMVSKSIPVVTLYRMPTEIGRSCILRGTACSRERTEVGLR